MFAALFAALLVLFPPVAPAAGGAPLPNKLAEQPSAPVVAPPTGVASVAPPTDVAEQLPQETDGRQIDCPDGVHVGVMTGGAVTGCP